MKSKNSVNIGSIKGYTLLFAGIEGVPVRETVSIVEPCRNKRHLWLQRVQVEFRPCMATAVMRQLEQTDLSREARSEYLLEAL